MATPTVPASKLLLLCPKCGTDRIRIAGQSGEPPVVYRRCEACEHVFGRPLNEPPPPDFTD